MKNKREKSIEISYLNNSSKDKIILLKINEMKKTVLFLLLVISLISCQEKAKKDGESGNSTISNAEVTSKASINFKSNPIAERYRTVIQEKYEELDVNFASYYIVVTWGCGSGCVSGAMVDIRDGNVYPMPEDKEWGGNGTYIDSKKESNLLLTAAVAQSPAGEIEESRKYWEWDEDLKKFSFMKEEVVLLQNNN